MGQILGGCIFERGVEIVQRALQRPLAQEKRAAVVIGEREVRPLLQRKLVVGHGQIVLALALIGDAACIDDSDILGVGRDRQAVGCDRLVVVALLRKPVAPHGEREGEVLRRRPPRRDQPLAGIQPYLGIALSLPAGRDIIAQ